MKETLSSKKSFLAHISKGFCVLLVLQIPAIIIFGSILLIPTYSDIKIYSVISNISNDLKNETVKKNCSYEDLNLQGPINVSFKYPPPTIEELIKNNTDLGYGGHYKPPSCKALHKVAIIIPYRNRESHLRYFLHYMHSMLKRQRLDYKIYIINQHGTGKFNRAKLLNVGFHEASSEYDFECFTFHDIDLIPEDDRILYTCPDLPRHLSRGVDKFKYKLPYVNIFGGAVQLSKKDFLKVNGFSNTFWGWGGEDDEFRFRLTRARLKISRYGPEIARYKMITHKNDLGNEKNPDRYAKITAVGSSMSSDGLSSLSFWVVKRTYHPLYTNITVDLFGPP